MGVAQIRTTWSGGPSAPGLTVMNVDSDGIPDYGAALAAVRAFWAANAITIPDEFTLQVDTLVEEFDKATGALMGEATYEGVITPVAGGGAGAYLQGAGARYDWLTSSIRNSRRVRGRTYVVPMTSNAFGTDGALLPAHVSVMQTAASDLLAALSAAGAPLVVWSRPSLAAPVGAAAPVIGARIPTKSAFLRGRRD